MDKQIYYYSRPIGLYIFSAVSTLTLIIKIENSGKVASMDIFLAVLYGGMMWGLGNLLWASVGDLLTPYIYKGREDAKTAVTLDRNSNQFITQDSEFIRHISKYISDGKLWARGMSILTQQEESELRRYFKERWDRESFDVAIPVYISATLIEIMKKHHLSDGVSLTGYGETVIPVEPLADMM